MSLLNVHVAPARVIIMTDTAGFTASGRAMRFVSKCFLLPHANIAVADRGAHGVSARFQRDLSNLHLPNGLDTVEDIAPDLLEEAVEDFARAVEEKLGAGRAEAFRLAEVVVAGWSERRGRMTALLFENTQRAFKPLEISGTVLGPASGLVASTVIEGDVIRFGTPKKFTGTDGMLAAARLQHAWVIENEGSGTGGDLIAVELTRHGAHVRSIGKLAGYDELLAQIATADPMEAIRAA